jgi:hypothetical protein
MENEKFKRRSKFEELTVGFKRESLHPAAQEDLESESLIHQARFPHNQWLRVQDSYMLSMLSRILRVCLWFSKQSTDQVTVLLHKNNPNFIKSSYRQLLQTLLKHYALC